MSQSVSTDAGTTKGKYMTNTVVKMKDGSTLTTPVSESARVTEDKVVDAIIDEAIDVGLGYESVNAQTLLDMLREAVDELAEQHPTGIYHIPIRALDACHDLLEVIMPDNEIDPDSGSAHALINDLLLNDEQACLVHTRHYVHCAVIIHNHRAT